MMEVPGVMDLEKSEMNSYDLPPPSYDDVGTMPTSSAAAVPVPAASYPVQQQLQPQVVYVDDDQRLIEVPLVESYTSHIMLACFTFWCCGCGCICGFIAFILAGRNLVRIIFAARRMLALAPVVKCMLNH